MNEARERWVVGCMTGTSLDGLDAAIVHIIGEGREMRARFAAMISHPLGDLTPVLRSMAEGEAHPPIDYMRAARRLGELHAQAVAKLCKNPCLKEGATGGLSVSAEPQQHSHGRTSRQWHAQHIDFVVAHGQTIWHAPPRVAQEAGMSWQLFDPWPLVRELGVPVCYDLRQADLIAGGQGAPITPLSDWVMYRDRAQAVVNLGGICNITLLDEDPSQIQAGDVGPCNLLLDGLCQRCMGQAFDRDGGIARGGRVIGEICSLIEVKISEAMNMGSGATNSLSARAQRGTEGTDGQAAGGTHHFEVVSKSSSVEHRSLGREQFTDAWLDDLVRAVGPAISPADLLRSAVEATAKMIVAWPREAGCRDLVLAGGGVRNMALIEAIRAQAGAMNVRLSDELGVPCEAREAMAMAVLGALSRDGIPITLPQVTGARQPGIAGVWAG